MTTSVITYSLAQIQGILLNFDAQLDEEIITQLAAIKNNSVFFKYPHPINIKYTLNNSGWRESETSNTIIYTPEIFENKVISNLNKLTGKNYAIIKKEVVKLFGLVSNLEIDNKHMVDIIFEKGAEEHIYSSIYSKFLAELIDEIDSVENLRDYIKFKSDTFYEQNQLLDFKDVNGAENYSDMCDINKDKKLILGKIIFISNLFNHNLIGYDWVNKYYQSLTLITDESSQALIGSYIDTLCAIVSTCGGNLKRAYPTKFKANFLEVLSRLSNNKERVKTKHRFKIKDVMDSMR